MYELVAVGMTRPAEIAAAERVSARIGQLSLASPATAGLITRSGRTVATGAVTLDGIAAAHRLDEAQADRIDRYRRERAASHAWLADHQQSSPPPPPPDAAVPALTAIVSPIFDNQAEYLVAMLANGPRDPDEGAEAIELVAGVLGGRILTAAR